jgi:tRNA threonylcarbamoyl adenosine modification protein YeaZ
MYSVLLDSSNKNLCVGVAKDGVILDKVEYEAWQRQSELMIPELNNLLAKHNINRCDIKEVIVANGPGSYTGVRIAVTIAKTTGVALNCDIYAISSLEAQKLCKSPTICLINARSNRSYIGVYNDEKVILKDCIMNNDDVLQYIKNHKNYKLTGELDYLNLKSEPYDIIQGLLYSKCEENKIKDVLSLKPVYMKD